MEKLVYLMYVSFFILVRSYDPCYNPMFCNLTTPSWS